MVALGYLTLFLLLSSSLLAFVSASLDVSTPDSEHINALHPDRPRENPSEAAPEQQSTLQNEVVKVDAPPTSDSSLVDITPHPDTLVEEPKDEASAKDAAVPPKDAGGADKGSAENDDVSKLTDARTYESLFMR